MTTALTLPQPTTHSTAIDTSRIGGVPYIAFVSAKSPRFAEWAAAISDLKEPDALLLRPTPYPPVRLSPFNLHFLAGTQFWVESDDEGNLVRVSEVEDRADDSLKECVEAVVLAYLNGGIVPSRVSFRTTKCPAAKTLAHTLKVAATPEWGTFSEQHASTLAIPEPALRFVGTIISAPRTSRGGRRYYQSSARVRPTSGAELKTLAGVVSDKGFREALETVYGSYEHRLEQLREASA